MKKNIAVIMGGYSSEYKISIKSGNVVYDHINKNNYTPYIVHILTDKWIVIDSSKNEFPINRHDFSIEIDNQKITFDYIFNVIHGSPGEDGKILAYFDLLNIPYSSAPFYQMALTFNKRDCLSIAKNYGIKIASSVYLNEGDTFDINTIIEKIGLPCFVKPNNAGSSFGISKVTKIQEFNSALETAFKEDSEILIESFLNGTEVSVGVIQYKDEILVLPITEIVSENDFFDYEAKYLGKSQEITPARITAIQQENVSNVAKHLYKSLNMSGFSRSEFIFIGDEPFFLEINTVPGMTETSLLPQQAKVAGINLTDLITDTIERK
jgi:D-alanine-D-alanine ligase